MNLRDLVPLPSERGIIIGATGTGKTVLGTRLIAYYRRVIAIDPKGTLGAGGERWGGHLRGYELASTPWELERIARKHDRVQYRPDMKFQNPDDWERVFSWIFRRGKTMVFTDEIADTHHHSFPPISLRRIITSGRELGIGHLGATQRPRHIDKRIMSEAERYYIFHLRDLDDRRLLKHRIGTGRLPSYAFWYSRDKEPFEDPIARKLRL